MKLLRLSWRNIWRNRRRAVITIASVFFAVFFCVLMMGFQKGVWDRMVDNMLRTQTGHIQIHAKGYWEDKIIDNFMFMDTATLSALENISDVENVSPRVELFAMAAVGSISKGIAIVGISPQKESQKSNLPSRIVDGNYLSETDEGILIGEGLAKYLKVSVGDTIALIGQGYHGASAAGLFPIRGVLKLMTSEMDNSVTYISLPAAQYFIEMPDGYSGVLISIKNNNKLDEVIKVISCQLSAISREYTADKEMLNQVQHDDSQQLKTENYEVLSWHFTMERLLQTAESDKAFGVIVLFILYVIVGFGILGTVIMLTNERIREFCVMISLGMPRLKLAAVISIELLIMSLIGVLLAFAVTLPVGYWYALNPIKISGSMAEMYTQYGMEPVLPMSVNPSIFTDQMSIVLVIVLLTVIYPINKIFKLKITTK